MRNLKPYLLFISLFFLGKLCFGQDTASFSGKLQVIGDKIEILADSNSNIPLQAAIKSTKYKKSQSQFPNLLITPYSYWIRFTVKNNTSQNALALHVAQPMIDHIDFYQLNGDSIVKSNFSGQFKNFGTRLINFQTFVYPITVGKGQSSTIYFYVSSGKQMVMPIYLGTEEQVRESAVNKDISFGIYIGIIMVMLLYNLFVYITVRDKNYIYYVLYLAIVLLTQACMEGYLFRFVLPNNPQLANISVYITTALIGLAAIEFSKNFLQAKLYTPKLYKVSYVFWALYVIQIVLAFAKHYNTSYTIMLASAMWSAVYVLSMAITILIKGFRSAKYFLIAWSFFIACVIVYVMKDFGILFPYNSLTSSALLIGSAVEAVLLSFALADKINIFKAEKEKSQEETLIALKENERIVREQNVILEQKVDERTSELNKTLVDLKDAQSQLVESEKMASLGQLTAGIAHEINNPINFVTSNINPLKRDIELMLEALTVIEDVGASDIPVAAKQKKIQDYKEELDFDYLTMEIKHLIKGINEGANRTAEIVKGLKIFSRLDEDDLKKADLNEGLESTMVIANNLLTTKIKVIKQYSQLPLVECYAGKLNQVFLNMISNAIYAIQKRFGVGDGGELSIISTCDETNVYITIKDNGIGMDEQTQKKIFEPFFTTKDVGEGTGLGLSIAYNTIKRHNGQIIVNSTLGEGTEFIMEIPIIFDTKTV